jgi:hypothetical protein|tara:strand:+ start:96 stop:356 length:261 start_codon:yes stop_codon:yes gene_type:complete
MTDAENFLNLLIEKRVHHWGEQPYKNLKKLYNMYFDFKGDYHLRNIIDMLIHIKLLKKIKSNKRFYYTFIYDGYIHKENTSGIVIF